NTALALSVLVFAAAFADARGGGRGGGRSFGHRSGFSGSRGFAGGGNFSRPLSRPTFARSRSTSVGATSHTGFASFSRSTGRSSFAGARLTGASGTGTAGGGAGGTGGTTSAPSAPPAYATPGAKILSAGQQPVYSTPSGGGTQSVDGGGFVAMDQSRAVNVGAAPGITWAPPDRTQSSGSRGGSGSGGSSNGSAFDPSF
ncbi:MAG TPA: hypothetical protein VH309_06390, partial [Elusimicrobiota bacterium]|nr:hypothetical protein [Elusimicrobiota bacterium]